MDLCLKELTSKQVNPTGRQRDDPDAFTHMYKSDNSVLYRAIDHDNLCESGQQALTGSNASSSTQGRDCDTSGSLYRTEIPAESPDSYTSSPSKQGGPHDSSNTSPSITNGDNGVLGNASTPNLAQIDKQIEKEPLSSGVDHRLCSSVVSGRAVPVENSPRSSGSNQQDESAVPTLPIVAGSHSTAPCTSAAHGNSLGGLMSAKKVGPNQGDSRAHLQTQGEQAFVPSFVNSPKPSKNADRGQGKIVPSGVGYRSFSSVVSGFNPSFGEEQASPVDNASSAPVERDNQDERAYAGDRIRSSSTGKEALTADASDADLSAERRRGYCSLLDYAMEGTSTRSTGRRRRRKRR
jgi:hypothetical protein